MRKKIGELKMRNPITKAHIATFKVSVIDNGGVELDMSGPDGADGVIEMSPDIACHLADLLMYASVPKIEDK